MDAKIPTLQDINDAYAIAKWLGSSASKTQKAASSICVRLFTSLGAQRAGHLVYQKVVEINSSWAGQRSAGQNFLKGGHNASSSSQKLIRNYYAILVRALVKPLLYNFTKKLYEEQMQVFLFPAMNPEDTKFVFDHLGIPAVKEPEDVEGKIENLNAVNPDVYFAERVRKELDEAVFGEEDLYRDHSSIVEEEDPEDDSQYCEIISTPKKRGPVEIDLEELERLISDENSEESEAPKRKRLRARE